MSTRKPSRFKGAKSKAKPQKAAQTSPRKDNSGFIQSFSRMIFLVSGALLFGFAIYSALNEKDVVNAYIDEHMPNLLRTEALLFGLIAAGFIYCAFKLVFKLAEKKYDYVVLAVALLAITGNFLISFDKDVGSFGDNASYIINSKSLIEKGGPYKLNHVDEPYDYKASLGFPVMLTPIVAIWGMDILKMKSLVFMMGSLSVLFFFLAFKKRLGIYAAAIIAILIGTYPIVVTNTSYVMTEVPFLFALSITLFATFGFIDATTVRKSVVYGIATVLLALLTYLTRAVGIGVIAGIIACMFFNIPFAKIFKKEVALLKSLEVRKFAFVTLLLGVLVLGWQMRGTGSSPVKSQDGTEQVVKNKSQAGTFMERDVAANFNKNYKIVEPLWAQQIFSEKLSRWYLSLGKSAKIKLEGPGLAAFNFFMLVALIVGLIRRRMVAFWFLFIVLVTLAGSISTQSVVFSRYLVVIVPFLIYLFMDMMIAGSEFISKRYDKPALTTVGSFAAIIFSGLVLSHNISGAAFNNQRQNAGDTYTIAFDNYIESARWIKENIDEDVVVASRKPRLYYVFSEKKGIVTVYSSTQTYNKEIADEILNRMRKRNAKILILDGFSTASRKVVLPLYQDNKELFKLVKTVGEKYPAYIFEFSG
ncbi:MAG: hypothetical protein GY751_06130 [Bacteroidetes bacterium]|nr:hypothetical protein [Bacteroidota bacterium]